MLLLSVPENKTGSWVIIESLERKSYSPNVEISIPSISILPSNIGKILKNANKRVDFPAPAISYSVPVLPTIASFSPGLTEKCMF